MARPGSQPATSRQSTDLSKLSSEVLRLRLQQMNLPITGNHARLFERLRSANGTRQLSGTILSDIFQVIYVLKMIYQVGKKQCSNSGRKQNDIAPLESDFIVQPPSLLEFPGPLTPPPHPPGISNSLRGGGLDVFWNHTLQESCCCLVTCSLIHHGLWTL